METLVALAPSSGLTAGACAALNLSRASIYRQRAHLARPNSASRQTEPAARARRAGTLSRTRSPARTALRRPGPRRGLCQPAGRRPIPLLDSHHVPHPGENQEVRERRDQLRHPAYQKPELLATPPTRSGPGTSPS